MEITKQVSDSYDDNKSYLCLLDTYFDCIDDQELGKKVLYIFSS